jgi:hypothetical protein
MNNLIIVDTREKGNKKIDGLFVGTARLSKQYVFYGINMLRGSAAAAA